MGSKDDRCVGGESEARDSEVNLSKPDDYIELIASLRFGFNIGRMRLLPNPIRVAEPYYGLTGRFALPQEFHHGLSRKKFIDLAESIDNLTGKWIRHIHSDSKDPIKPSKGEFADGIEIDLKNPDWRLIKPLVWW